MYSFARFHPRKQRNKQNDELEEQFKRPTVDLSLSAVHLSIKSATFTSTVPFMGLADTNCPSILVT